MVEGGFLARGPRSCWCREIGLTSQAVGPSGALGSVTGSRSFTRPHRPASATSGSAWRRATPPSAWPRSAVSPLENLANRD